MRTTRIGCTVELIFENGVLVGQRQHKGYVHDEDDDISIERGPPNLELQFGDTGKLENIVDRSPTAQIFERIVAAISREFPQDDKRVLL